MIKDKDDWKLQVPLIIIKSVVGCREGATLEGNAVGSKVVGSGVGANDEGNAVGIGVGLFVGWRVGRSTLIIIVSAVGFRVGSGLVGALVGLGT